MNEARTITQPRFAVIGANHQSADAGFRDRLYIEEENSTGILEKLRDLGIGQAVIISTCDRIEFQIAAEAPEEATRQIETLIAERVGAGRKTVSENLIRRYDDDAIHHVFRVACALESQVIGESQVLGQVKDSVGTSKAAGMIGPELDGLYQATFQLAKTVRTDTSIGEGAVTVASAAIQVAKDLYGDLSSTRMLLVGLGDVGDLLLKQFRLAGLQRVTMTGTSRRVERAARRADCHFAPMERLDDVLREADIIVTASSTGRYLIDRAMIEQALKARRRARMVLFDCGIPADIDPAIGGLDNAFLYTLEDVERLAREGEYGRGEAASEASRMVSEGLVQFRKSRAALEGVPALVSLRQHFEAIRRELLEGHPHADAEEISRLLINRLLHEPSETLRSIAQEGDVADLRDTITVNRVLARLFHLSFEDGQDQGADSDKQDGKNS